MAARRARGRVATVAVNSFMFKQPVLVGDLVTFYAEISRVGRTSITVDVEVYAQRNPTDVIMRQGDRGEPHVRRGRRRPPAAGVAAGMSTRSAAFTARVLLQKQYPAHALRSASADVASPCRGV